LESSSDFGGKDKTWFCKGGFDARFSLELPGDLWGIAVNSQVEEDDFLARRRGGRRKEEKFKIQNPSPETECGAPENKQIPRPPRRTQDENVLWAGVSFFAQSCTDLHR